MILHTPHTDCSTFFLETFFIPIPSTEAKPISRLLTSWDQVQVSSRILAAMNSLSLTPEMPSFSLRTSSAVWTEVNAAAEALPVFGTTHLLSRREGLNASAEICRTPMTAVCLDQDGINCFRLAYNTEN